MIAAFRSDHAERGFNLTIALDGILTHTPEARAAISAFQKVYQNANKYERTDDIRSRISLALTGRPGHNKGREWPDEVKAKFGAPKGNTNRLGKVRTTTEKARISASVKAAHINNPALGIAVAQSNRTRIISDETKAKMSAAQRARYPPRN